MNLAPAPIHVSVAQRDALIRSGVISALKDMRDVVFDDDAGDPAAARSQPSKIVIADVESATSLLGSAPGRPGVRPLVIATGADREWEIRHALNHDVRGYLTLGFSIDELREAVQRGTLYLSTRAAARLAESVRFQALTERETDVLRLVADGLCNKAVGRELDISVGTVKAHLKSTYEKLMVSSRTQAVVAAERRGLFARADGRTDAAVPTY